MARYSYTARGVENKLGQLVDETMAQPRRFWDRP